MEDVECVICKNSEKKILFQKASRDRIIFNLIKCKNCGLEFLSPRPGVSEIGRYYNIEYFTRRTERGYNNYFSDELRKEIERVIELNLKDLNFFGFEQVLSRDKKALDIGCAAGYFVDFLKRRGWEANGVDISGECVDFAVGAGLNVSMNDYLEIDFPEKFDLITLWATIEHLHYPDLFLEKAYNELNRSGLLFVSTCRVGGINFMRLFGKKWRFYNFPEHLYFFSYHTIKKILEQKGFKVVKYATYGSGLGKPGSLFRKISDFLAKKFHIGDMMLISAKKNPLAGGFTGGA